MCTNDINEIVSVIKKDYLNFFVSHLGLREDFKNRFLMESKDGNAYQYVNASTLEKIISNQQLQATNLSFMNDSNEFKHGLEIFYHRLIAATDNLNDENTISVPELSEPQKKRRKLIIEKLISFSEMHKKTVSNHYARCFSTEKDLLSQWRAYGDYAVGFNAKELFDLIESNFQSEQSFIAGKVIYKEQEQCEIVDDLINKIIDYFDNEKFTKYSVNTLEKGVSTLLDTMFNGGGTGGDIDDIIGCFKNEVFSEEKEIRFLFKKPTNKLIEFRNSNNIITPYIKLNDSAKLLPIRKIIVSPILRGDFERIKVGINLLLENKKYNPETVEIIPSEIPYRT